MAAIPNRAVFRSQEVCEIAEVQLYVLRSWEAEFPDLGLSKGAGSPRVYRKGDVERVLRLKHLLFVEGLTLAGARRQLSEEDPAMFAVESEDDANVSDEAVGELLDREVRKTLGDVRSGLHGILGVLTGGADRGTLRLAPATARRSAKKTSKPARAGKKVQSSSRSVRAARAERSTRPAKKSPGKRRR
ncbi:MAG TPA: MerR family transcriptional regulator [Vicinamibacterales bacterium]|nr:MerR family transcriptional regulator [Vicinamibacterales bacterium]